MSLSLKRQSRDRKGAGISLRHPITRGSLAGRRGPEIGMRLSLLVCALLPVTGVAADWRDIRQGREIPTEPYADHPYDITANEGAPLGGATRGAGCGRR